MSELSIGLLGDQKGNLKQYRASEGWIEERKQELNWVYRRSWKEFEQEDKGRWFVSVGVQFEIKWIELFNYRADNHRFAGAVTWAVGNREKINGFIRRASEGWMLEIIILRSLHKEQKMRVMRIREIMRPWRQLRPASYYLRLL